jgi:hypothetical protein
MQAPPIIFGVNAVEIYFTSKMHCVLLLLMTRQTGIRCIGSTTPYHNKEFQDRITYSKFNTTKKPSKLNALFCNAPQIYGGGIGWLVS